MITQEKLNEIVANHGRWLRGEEGGCRAYLAGAYLAGANLTRANLAGAYLADANLTRANLTRANLAGANLADANLTDANLTGANLTRANLAGANLTGANLTDANLTGAYLTDANLTGAYLAGAYLTDANLDKKYYQVVRIGSRKGTTTYNATDDIVSCGCWNKYKGGTLNEFTARVESVYGEKGSEPNKPYYDEYMAAIDFFKKMKELSKK